MKRFRRVRRSERKDDNKIDYPTLLNCVKARYFMNNLLSYIFIDT